MRDSELYLSAFVREQPR